MIVDKTYPYDLKVTIDTRNELNEKVHFDIYSNKGRVFSNINVSHDGEQSYSVIAVEAADLIELGKRLESYIKRNVNKSYSVNKEKK